MNDLQTVYLSIPTYTLGTLYDIKNLPELNSDSKKLLQLQNEGIQYFSKLSQVLEDAIAFSMQQTLTKDKINPLDVSYVIIASETILNTDIEILEKMNLILGSLSLNNAIPIRISLSGCNNITVAVKVAVSLLNNSEGKHVLLVVAGALRDHNSSRLFIPDIGVISDGVACCLLSCTNKQGYLVNKIHLLNNVKLWAFLKKKEQMGNYVLGCISLIKKLTKNISSLDRSNSIITTNNYFKSVVNIFCKAARFEEDNIYLDNVKIGHIHAADVLVNLADITNTKKIIADKKIYLMSSSPSSFGLISLTKV